MTENNSDDKDDIPRNGKKPKGDLVKKLTISTSALIAFLFASVIIPNASNYVDRRWAASDQINEQIDSVVKKSKLLLLRATNENDRTPVDERQKAIKELDQQFLDINFRDLDQTERCIRKLVSIAKLRARGSTAMANSSERRKSVLDKISQINDMRSQFCLRTLVGGICDIDASEVSKC